jgi:O-methyltransferase
MMMHQFKITKPKSLINKNKIESLIKLLQRCESIEGEVWECGTYQGGSALAISQNTNKTIRLFDSWEGLPEPCQKDNYHKKGDFSNVDFKIIKYLFRNNKNVHLHRGWIPNTFKGLEDKLISFAHIDLDLYKSYMDALDFIYPRLKTNGIIAFDDYKKSTCKGATFAINEFFNKKQIVKMFHHHITIKS